MFVTAFLLGLFGSAGHCVGMCGGVTLLLTRSGVGTGLAIIVGSCGASSELWAAGWAGR